MSTPQHPSLAGALFGRTRRTVLGVLYGNAEESFYLRDLARRTRAGLGAVQREVKKLTEAGLIRRSVRGREVYYQANSECPVFAELKGLVVKSFGLADALRAALSPLAPRLRVAFIYGSFARNKARPASDIDIMVVGKIRFSEVVAALSQAQAWLGREINPTVFPPDEFRSKLAARHPFVKTVLKGEKIFLIGDERAIEGLAAERVAERAPKQPRRN
jgi:predicted nucleotidyltransferase